MREPNELEKKQYQRLQEIFTAARSRYLKAGGDPKRAGGILNGQDCLTTEEKQEIVKLGKQVFSLGRVIRGCLKRVVAKRKKRIKLRNKLILQQNLCHYHTQQT